MTGSPSQLLFLLALLPQLFLAVFAPALVVCQEGSGAQGLELNLAGCCAPEVQQPGGDEGEAARADREEECGGCQDSALGLCLKRDDGSGPTLLLPPLAAEQPAWRWPVFASPVPAPAPNLLCDSTLAALRTVRLRC